MRLHFFKKVEQLFFTGEFSGVPIVVKGDELLYTMYEPGCSTPTVY
jgi:hypothetical protein